MIHFDLPKNKSSIIKVIGIGGAGCNAVEAMFEKDIQGVNFIVCNTDAQALSQSKIPNKIQLGPYLTQGLGAVASPEIGREATEESLEEIKRILETNTKMAFITAGMGGGTGTGGAPILAEICKDLNILTVGIVTTPFAYEGKKRTAQAEEGITSLKKHVDTLLVISNDKLRKQYGNLKMKDAFAKADDILATAVKCITDVIDSTGQINVDFADVCTVISNGGMAILGTATSEGENRALKAIEEALEFSLLVENDIRGAKWILININSAEGEYEFTMDEVETIQNYLLSKAGGDTDFILGLGYDNTKGKAIGITLIATGFPGKQETEKTELEEKKDADLHNLLDKSSNDLELGITQSELEKFSVNIFLRNKPIPYLLIIHLNKLYSQLHNKLKTLTAPHEKSFLQKVKALFLSPFNYLFKSSDGDLADKGRVDYMEEPKNLLSEIVLEINHLLVHQNELSVKIGPVILIKQLEKNNNYSIILKKISPQLSDKLNNEPMILRDFDLLKSLIYRTSE